MKHSDFKILFNLGLTLSRQLPKIPLTAIQDFVLGLHGCSVKINRLNMSIENIVDVLFEQKIESLRTERQATIQKAENVCTSFNKAIVSTYGQMDSTGLASFRVEAGSDPRYFALKLYHRQWTGQPISVPCSQ